VLAPFGVLLLGLFLDLFWGGPMGLWALSLLLAYAMALAMRSMMSGQSRIMMWAWFASAVAIMMLGGYLVTMLDSLAMPSLIAVFWQFLATVLLFPFAQSLVDRFEDADVRFR
jgi:rod shape-determining protein MreD